jgi:hypothetical protein
MQYEDDFSLKSRPAFTRRAATVDSSSLYASVFVSKNKLPNRTMCRPELTTESAQAE